MVAFWPSVTNELVLMVKLDLCCAVLMCGLEALAAFDGPALAAVAISGVNSLFVMPYKPAVAAITPQLVGEDELAAANALYSTVSKLAMIAGPALGAVLLLIGDLTFVFSANALSFLVVSSCRLAHFCPQHTGGRERRQHAEPVAPDAGRHADHLELFQRHGAGRLRRCSQLCVRR